MEVETWILTWIITEAWNIFWNICEETEIVTNFITWHETIDELEDCLNISQLVRKGESSVGFNLTCPPARLERKNGV